MLYHQMLRKSCLSCFTFIHPGVVYVSSIPIPVAVFGSSGVQVEQVNILLETVYQDMISVTMNCIHEWLDCHSGRHAPDHAKFSVPGPEVGWDRVGEDSRDRMGLGRHVGWMGQGRHVGRMGHCRQRQDWTE